MQINCTKSAQEKRPILHQNEEAQQNTIISRQKTQKFTSNNESGDQMLIITNQQERNEPQTAKLRNHRRSDGAFLLS